MTLADAPLGLQTAVRATLGQSSVPGSVRQAKLTASDGSTYDYFGAAVAISGSAALVGAVGKDSFTGAAYVFVRTGATWWQQAELTASDGAANDFFGGSVALSGSTSVVGASGKNTAYVFVRSGQSWSQQAELTASDGTESDFFGASVAVSGSTAVVGAAGKNRYVGAAYVFVRSGQTWSQQRELLASDGVANDSFGDSVAISGSSVVVGAPVKNSYTGAAYIFVRSGQSWSQQAELSARDGLANDSFGNSVAISGSTAILSAVGKNATGAAYVFVRSGQSWSQQAELSAPDGVSGDEFGSSVAISGPIAVVGAESKDGSSGAAYVFVQSGGRWSPRGKLTAHDTREGDSFGNSVAISGSGLVVGALWKHAYTGAAYAFWGL
jgi:hypothetical protein